MRSLLSRIKGRVFTRLQCSLKFQLKLFVTGSKGKKTWKREVWKCQWFIRRRFKQQFCGFRHKQWRSFEFFFIWYDWRWWSKLPVFLGDSLVRSAIQKIQTTSHPWRLSGQFSDSEAPSFFKSGFDAEWQYVEHLLSGCIRGFLPESFHWNQKVRCSEIREKGSPWRVLVWHFSFRNSRRILVCTSLLTPTSFNY